MKKLAIILTAIALIASLFTCFAVTAAEESVWDGTAPAANENAAFSGGSGTEADPYLLSSAADLAQLAVNCNAAVNTYPGKYFKLTTDIALNSNYENYADWEENAPANTWIVIGKTEGVGDANAFKGVFDGDGHVIRGMYTTRTMEGTWVPQVGFFGVFAGEVYNLGFEYCAAVNDLDNDNWATGILAAHLNATPADTYAVKVSGCYVDKSIAVARGEIGMIAGEALYGVEITNCWTNGVVKALYSDRGNAAGLVGEIYTGADNGALIIKDCYSFVDIVTEQTGKAGQIYGTGNDSPEQIINCYIDSTKCATACTPTGAPTGTLEIIDLAGTKGTVKSMKLNAKVWVDGANGPVLKVFQADAGNNTNPGTADMISVCVLAAAAAAGVCVLASKKRR